MWMVSLLSSSCCGVTFPCKVCNISRKGVAEVPAYRVALFWRILNHERRDLNNEFSCGWPALNRDLPLGAHTFLLGVDEAALAPGPARSLFPSSAALPVSHPTPSLGRHPVERGPWLHIHSKHCSAHFINIREHRLCSRSCSSIGLHWFLKC